VSAHKKDVFRTNEEKQAQIEGYLAQMKSLGLGPGPIGVFARVTAKPGRRNEILRELGKFEAIVRDERLTLFYGVFVDAVDPNLTHVYQLYSDWDALCTHMRDPRYLDSLDQIVNASATGSPEYHFGQPQYFFRGGAD